MDKKPIFIIGPDISGEGKLIGGQLSHLLFLREGFRETDFELRFIASSSSLRAGGNFAKLLSLVKAVWIIIFYTRFFSAFHVNSTLNFKSVVRDAIICFFVLLKGGRFIIQFHGGAGFSRGDSKIKDVLLVLVKFIFKKASCIYFLTTQQLSDFQKYFSLKGELIDNFLPVKPTFGNSVARCSKEKNDTLNLLFMARLEREKGLLELFEWFNCSKYRNRVILHIAGDGTLASECKAFTAESDGNVIFHGLVMNDEKFKLLQECDFLILPSYAEAFPYSILEAYSVGTPVISTNVGAVSRLVYRDTTGYILSGLFPGDFEDIFDHVFSSLDVDKFFLRNLQVGASNKFLDYDVNAMKAKFSEIWSAMYA